MRKIVQWIHVVHETDIMNVITYFKRPLYYLHTVKGPQIIDIQIKAIQKIESKT